MTSGITRNLEHGGRQSATEVVGRQPLPRAVGLLVIAALSVSLWFGIYKLVTWLI